MQWPNTDNDTFIFTASFNDFPSDFDLDMRSDPAKSTKFSFDSYIIPFFLSVYNFKINNECDRELLAFNFVAEVVLLNVPIDMADSMSVSLLQVYSTDPKILTPALGYSLKSRFFVIGFVNKSLIDSLYISIYEHFII